ncbi:hypothetical protein [Ramlibacter rhizophilus]|uniref:Transmembrane protein n=1 Tax=Ramlibacter rhizophilus TaxID=1781167 RepID=A0A4Z0BYE7_9BURK|nr:hypothetical protein [Ramlibacter rhizophilus]TFZ03330.1 hypothetical protein EZ242_05455 [Ramlibacter rhizophilus]
MYLVIIGWLYVVLMMSVAEATNTTGSVLGAVVTFVLYGLLPAGLLAYILGTPGRRRAIKAREAAEAAEAQRARENATARSGEPDTGREAAADPVSPVRKEP